MNPIKSVFQFPRMSTISDELGSSRSEDIASYKTWWRYFASSLDTYWIAIGNGFNTQPHWMVGLWFCKLWAGNYNVTSRSINQYIPASIYTGFGTTNDKPHIAVGVSHWETNRALKGVDVILLFDGLGVHLPTCQCITCVYDHRTCSLGCSYPHLVVISMTGCDVSCTISPNSCSTVQ